MTAISKRAAPLALRFGLSTLASVLLHLAVFWPLGAFLQHPVPAPTLPLEAMLLAPLLETEVVEPEAVEPEAAAAEPALAEAPKPAEKPATSLDAVPLAPTFTPKPAKPPEQIKQEFYPREAIARGLEGDVIVLLSMSSAGAVAEASVATSSGHALLDAAALRAVRAISGLQTGQRQMLLPVQFRLD